VTNNGLAEVPRSTGTAWVAVWKAVFGHPDHRDTELSVRVRTQAGPATGVKVGVTVDHQQAQLAQPMQDRANRRELTQIELTGAVRQHLRQNFSAFGHYLRQAGIGSHHGCRSRTPRTQIVHVHGHERAATRFHVPSLPHLTTAANEGRRATPPSRHESLPLFLTMRTIAAVRCAEAGLTAAVSGCADLDDRYALCRSVMPVDRASRVGHVVDLDGQARANHDTYTTAKKASDGLEHGFLELSRD
jgi:hypothetical protein